MMLLTMGSLRSNAALENITLPIALLMPLLLLAITKQIIAAFLEMNMHVNRAYETTNAIQLYKRNY